MPHIGRIELVSNYIDRLSGALQSVMDGSRVVSDDRALLYMPVLVSEMG